MTGSVEHCALALGSAPGCLSCPLTKAGNCALALGRFSLYRSLLAKKYGIPACDWQTLLTETFNGIVWATEKAWRASLDPPDGLAKEDEPPQADPGSANASPSLQKVSNPFYLDKIFKNTVGEYFRRQNVRFSWWTEITITSPPEGLDSVVRRNHEYLRFDGKVLAAAPQLPDEVHLQLRGLSGDPQWRKAVQKLRDNTHRPMPSALVSGEGETIDLHSPGMTPEENIEAHDDFIGPLIWKRIGSERARHCLELYERFGNVFAERIPAARLARKCGCLPNTITQQIRRCKQLIWDGMIRALDDNPECRDLYFRLYYAEAAGRREGEHQRFARVANEIGVDLQGLAKRYLRCGQEALRRLEAEA